MPELVSATALLAMPPLMAYLAVRCLREVIPAWHVGGRIDSFLALHAFFLGMAIGALLMAAAYSVSRTRWIITIRGSQSTASSQSWQPG